MLRQRRKFISCKMVTLVGKVPGMDKRDIPKHLPWYEFFDENTPVIKETNRELLRKAQEKQGK